MKNLIQSAVKNTKAGQFLVRKCRESDAWAWGVTITRIDAILGVVMI